MAGHVSPPNPTATGEVLDAATTKIDEVTGGTNLQNGSSAHERLQYDFSPAVALEAELSLGFLANYPDFDVEMDWVDPFPADNINATEAPEEFYDPNDEALAEQSLDQSLIISLAQSERNSLSGFPYDLGVEAPLWQSLDANLSASTTHFVGDSDLNDHEPGCFELPEKPPELDFLESLQLFGTGTQPAMSADVGYNTQALLHSTDNSPVQGYESRIIAWAASSGPNPTNESRTVLTNPHAAQRQHDTSQVQPTKGYIQNRAYRPLDQAPESWDIFEYTKDGELDPSRLFSAEEINRFLFAHPLHRGYRNLKDSELRLRVHKTPASSAVRFPHKLQCRFKECPFRTCGQGHVLIVVDELSVQHPDHDPFLNAAYLHLWCIERYLNFPEICEKLHVTTKGRDARLEGGSKNRFNLSLFEEERVVENFVIACSGKGGIRGNPWVARCPDQQTNGCPHYGQSSHPYKGTLCHQLAITKLHYGGQGRINLRKAREDIAGYGGANITRHLGDLSKEAELREFSRSHKHQNQLKPNPKTRRYYRQIEEEEQSGYSHSEFSHPHTHRPRGVSDPHRANSTNKNRTESEGGQALDSDIVQERQESRNDPLFRTPEWNSNESSRIGLENRETEDDYFLQGSCMADTPEMSPFTTLTTKRQRTRLQLPTIGTRPPQADQSSPNNTRWSSTSEDQSEGELKLELLAAQTRRRALEIENVKAAEEALALKLTKMNKKKRHRDDGDDDGNESDSRGKRSKI